MTWIIYFFAALAVMIAVLSMVQAAYEDELLEPLYMILVAIWLTLFLTLVS